MPEPKLQIEARLTCPTCQGVPFLLWRRETRPDSGVFEHVIWPTEGTNVPPPATTGLICPVDGATLVRVAP